MNFFIETVKEVVKAAASWSFRQKLVTGVATGAMTVSAVGGGMVGYQVTHQPGTVVEQTIPVMTVEAAPAAQAEPIAEEQSMEIPAYREYVLSSESVAKDLSISFLDKESGERLTGVGFSVVVAPKNAAEALPQAQAVNAYGQQLEALKAAGFDALAYSDEIRAEVDGILTSEEELSSKQSQLGALSAWEKVEQESGAAEENGEEADAPKAYINAKTGEPVTVYDFFLTQKQELIDAYAEALASIGGETYTDDDSDGKIYIPELESGDYRAFCVPVSGYDTKEYESEVSVKEELEYKPVENIEQKVVASAPEAEKPAEAAVVEQTLTDTVKVVESKTEEAGEYEEAQVPTVKASKNGEKKAARLSDGTEMFTIDSSAVTLYALAEEAANSVTINAKRVAPEGYEVGEITAKSSNTGALSVEGSGDSFTLRTSDAVVYHTQATVTFNARIVKPAGSEGTSGEKKSDDKKEEEKKEEEQKSDNGTSTESKSRDDSDTSEGSDANAQGIQNGESKPQNAQEPQNGDSKPQNAQESQNSDSKPQDAQENGNAADASGTNGNNGEAAQGAQADGNSGEASSNGNTDGDAGAGASSEGTAGTSPEARLYQRGGFRMMSEVADDTTATVTLTVTIIGTKEELKTDAGETLYVTDAQNAEAATVADADKTLFKKAGETVYYGWQTIEGKQYYYDENGKPVTGEQVIEGVRYNFGSDGAVIKNGRGVDVSKWQGNIDWGLLSPNISFAIIRCAYRGSNGALSIDPMYASNMRQAKANGVRTGIYIYSVAMNELEAVEEASLAIKLANEQGGVSLPIYIDMENSAQGRLSRDELTAIANAFCVTVQGAGYRPGIYANYKWFTEKLDTGSLNASIWCARYNTVCGLPFKYDIWQYSQTGTMPGVKGHIDMNEGNL